jgi:hypothetical protein
MTYITNEYLIDKFAHLLSNQDGTLWDNHEIAGEDKSDYQYLPISRVSRISGKNFWYDSII